MEIFMKNLLLTLLVTLPFVIFPLFKHCFPEHKPKLIGPECSVGPGYAYEIMVCEKAKTNQFDLNYLGRNVTMRSRDSNDLVLCTGDTFGDLNDTYVTIKNCYLAMYHQGKMIWSSNLNPAPGDELICAFSLKRDRSLALYKEEFSEYPEDPRKRGFNIWGSETRFNPERVELRAQGQKIQIIQTFKDGTQRLFYADANHQEFQEDLGKPIKIADKFVIKNHQDDEDNIVLRRNEYIGDLNETYLILQTNCDLQLINKNMVVWSFSFRHQMICVLKVQKGGEITISQILTIQGQVGEFSTQSIIMEPMGYREVISSQITFEDDQPIIIQTLKNGSEQIFSSGPGKDNALKLKKEPRQIAENMIVVSRDGLKEFSLQRMDYIGDLDALHLILEQNCSLILANGDQKLWEFQKDDIVMDCSLSLHSDGFIDLKTFYDSNGRCSNVESLVKRVGYYEGDFINGLELRLENNQLIIIRQRTDKAPDFFHAGSNTRGLLFQRISERSLMINHDDHNDQILPKMGYIGDLNGVYVIFEENCHWVLYNKTQVIWESGVYPDDSWDSCKLVLKRDGNVNLLNGWLQPVWSTMNLTDGTNLEKKLLKTELIVNDDGLWLVHAFHDGTVLEYMAMKGTNNFRLLSGKEKFNLNLDL